MSGFEIAGIVLATLPLLTPIVQNTLRSLSTRRYDQQLQKLIRNLKTEQVNFQNVIERLIDGLVPASQIQAMINDPLGDLWRDEKTVLNIRGRLWDRAALETFETTLQSIRESVDELHEKLRALSSSKASLLTRARFQFSDYEKSLTDIKASIANLMTLTSDSVTMEPSRRVRSQGPFLTFLQTTSQSLYRAIRSGLPCQPHCHHGVGLRLKHRKSVLNPRGNEDEIMRGLEFEVAISGASTAQDAVPSWQEILVKAVVDTASTETTATTAAKTTTQATAAAAIAAMEPPSWPPTRPAFPIRLKSALKSSKRTGITGSVNFGSLKAPSSSTPSSKASTGTSTIIQRTTLAAHGLTESLTVAAGTTVKTCMSLYEKLDDVQQLHDHRIILDGSARYAVLPLSVATAGDAGRQSVISLREVLERKEGFFLSYRDRLQIAVTISSSVLQLHGSPWLANDTLSSHDIYFFVNAGANKRGNSEVTVLREEPFLMKCDTSGAPIVAAASSAGTCSPPSTKHLELLSLGVTTSALSCNKTLLSLGYLLLELVSNENTLDPFRHSPTPRSGGIITASLPDYLAAHRALVRVVLPSDNYRGAVSRCLQGGLHKLGRGLESEDFCQEVYSEVVALLERDLESI